MSALWQMWLAEVSAGCPMCIALGVLLPLMAGFWLVGFGVLVKDAIRGEI